MSKQTIRTVFQLWLLFVVCSIFAPLVSASDRVALIVGNGDYYDTAGAVDGYEEVSELATVLIEKFGFDDVVVEEDLTSSALKSALDTYIAKLETAEVGFFFYTGHAILLDNRIMMVPIDIDLNSRREARKAVSLHGLVAGVEGISSVAVIDACWTTLLANGWGERPQFSRARVCESLERIETDLTSGKMVILPSTVPISPIGVGEAYPGGAGALAQRLRAAPLSGDFESILRGSFDRNNGDSPFVGGSLLDVIAFDAPVQGEVKPKVVARELESSVAVETTPQPEEVVPLYVLVAPESATVKIMNIKPRYQPGMLLEAGVQYILRIESTGYQTVETAVVLKAGPDGAMRITVDLQKIPEDRLVTDSTTDSKPKTEKAPAPAIASRAEQETLETAKVNADQESVVSKPQLSRSDLRFAQSRFEAVRDAIVDRSLLTANSLVEPGKRNEFIDTTESADAIRFYQQVLRPYANVELEIRQLSSNQARGEVTAILRITRMAQSSGDEVVPSPNWRDARMITRKVYGSVSGESEWTPVTLKRQ